MLHLILGRARTGKTTRCMERLAGNAARGIGGNILIVPEQYSHEAERELCRVCGDHMSLYGEVLSFTRLAARVEAELGSPGPLLDQGGRLLCMSLALDAVGSRLTFYKGIARKPEFQRDLLSALDSFKSACVDWSELDATGTQEGGVLGLKLRDLSLIFEAYDAISARSGADPADRLTLLAHRIGDSSLGRDGAFFIDGFTDFTPQELAVIRTLLQRGTQLTICLTCDPETEEEQFYPAQKTRTALRRLCEELDISCQEEYIPVRTENTPLAHLERQLFAPRRKPFSGTLQGELRLFKAENIYDECALAAATALTLVREQGARWRDIAVAVRGFDAYAAPLETTFLQYGVPLFLARKAPIASKSIPALIDGAFEIITGGWEYEDVFAYLKTGLTGLDSEDCDLLENYVYLWSLRGSAWTSNRDWSLHPEGYNAPRTPASDALLARLNMLRRQVSGPLLAFQKDCAAAHTASDYARALAGFLDAIRLPEQLQRRTELLEANGQSLYAAEYTQLWDAVVTALEQWNAVLGDRSMTTEECARLWTLLLNQYDVGAIPISYDRVSAGDLDRMRRRNIRHLILLGASDDRIPLAQETSGLFSDRDREALLGAGIDIGTAEEGLYREMNLVYNCLTLPAQTLTVSYCTKDATGNQCRPSFVIQGISRLFNCTPKAVDSTDLKLSAPGPAFSLAAENNGAPGKAARLYFQELGAGDRLAALDHAAHLGRGTLGPESVKRLYGDTLRLTASRVDKLSSCKFSFFLQYGLRAKPRQKAGFNPPELGTFIHYLLEHVAVDLKASGGFDTANDADIDALTDNYVALYVKTELNDFRERSSRFIYLFRRLTDSARQIVRDMVGELRVSDFRPLDFELDFSRAEEIAPYTVDPEGRVVITGIADRVDGWVHDGKLYLRVLDYKTGVRKFSLSDVCSGQNLQMLLYLFALEQEGETRYGYEVVPAGVLYVPARDRILSLDGPLEDGEVEAQRMKLRRRSGLLLQDPQVLYAMEKSYDTKYIPVTFKNDAYTGDSLASAEQLGRLSAYIRKTLADLAEELRRGSINADPFYRNQLDNACLWCDYFDACHFDETGDCRRYLPTLKPADAWSVIEGGAENNG
jgi:ATP-dependent helicase/nuclease subunit B